MASEDMASGVPLRLYLDLEQGHVADLIAVSEASIAFAKGVKQIAYLLDPTFEIEIGLIAPTSGSLWQNSWLRAKGEFDKKRELYLIAASAVIWFMQPPAERWRDQQWKPILDRYLPDATPEEEAQVERICKPDVARSERESAFLALYTDEGINGVAAAIERKKPARDQIIERSEFEERAGKIEQVADDEATELDRTTVGPLHVVLVSPVFDPGTRRWKFATAQGEFGATIRDRAFLERFLQGKMRVPMQAGIEMDIQLETRERLVQGVWQVAERNVLEVEQVFAPPPPAQGQLFSKDGE